MRTVVAITGASSGIGAVFAKKLAPGHDLLLIARRQDRLEDLSRQLSAEHGAHVDILVADLAKQDDLDRVAERIETEPNLTLLVNNAGFGSRGLFWNAPYDQQEQMHKLHYDRRVKQQRCGPGCKLYQHKQREDIAPLCNTVVVAAQSVPRTPWGDPDLQGIWPSGGIYRQVGKSMVAELTGLRSQLVGSSGSPEWI